MKYGKFISLEDKEDVKKFNFVAKAVSKDEYRCNLMVCKCEDGQLFATDGKRLHFATITDGMGFENGKYYVPLKNTKSISWFAEVKSEIQAWPDINNVIPKKENCRITKEIYLRRKTHEDTITALCVLTKNLDKDDGLKPHFFYDLPQGTPLFASFFDDKKQISVTNEDETLTAIIMPMSII